MPYPAKTSPEAILQAAMDILEQHGPEALSMRSLADALEIKAPSLYRHYADRDALISAIADEAARLLLEAIQEPPRSKNNDPAQKLRAAAKAYLRFARSRPALYGLIHSTAQPGSGNSKALWNRVLELVAGITGNPDNTAGAVALWSFLHGYASLDMGGLFGPSGDRGGFEAGVEAIITGLPRTG